MNNYTKILETKNENLETSSPQSAHQPDKPDNSVVVSLSIVKYTPRETYARTVKPPTAVHYPYPSKYSILHSKTPPLLPPPPRRPTDEPGPEPGPVPGRDFEGDWQDVYDNNGR